jgi:hypothetical protein
MGVLMPVSSWVSKSIGRSLFGGLQASAVPDKVPLFDGIVRVVPHLRRLPHHAIAGVVLPCVF